MKRKMSLEAVRRKVLVFVAYSQYMFFTVNYIHTMTTFVGANYFESFVLKNLVAELTLDIFWCGSTVP